MLRALLASAIVFTLVACGPPPLPQKPQLITDRDSVGFLTYLGTQPQESLLLQNEGLETLRITGVTIAGDTAFTLEGPNKLEIKGRDHGFLRIFFAPKEARSYSASITLVSNAENFPQKVVTLTGMGVAPGTDAGP